MRPGVLTRPPEEMLGSPLCTAPRSTSHFTARSQLIATRRSFADQESQRCFQD